MEYRIVVWTERHHGPYRTSWVVCEDNHDALNVMEGIQKMDGFSMVADNGDVWAFPKGVLQTSVLQMEFRESDE